MQQTPKRQFLRRTIKVGNSSGVLLPKALLGSQVIVRVVNPPLNIKRDCIKLIAPFLEDILGAYLVNLKDNHAEILAVSFSTSKIIEKGNYKVNIIPILVIKKLIKENPVTREKIQKAKPIINKRLLIELKKEAGI